MGQMGSVESVEREQASAASPEEKVPSTHFRGVPSLE